MATSQASMGSLLVDTAQHYTDKMIDYSNQKNFNRQAQADYRKNQSFYPYNAERYQLKANPLKLEK